MESHIIAPFAFDSHIIVLSLDQTSRSRVFGLNPTSRLNFGALAVAPGPCATPYLIPAAPEYCPGNPVYQKRGIKNAAHTSIYRFHMLYILDTIAAAT
jgi:hypothetical protein